jgi:predicted RecB family nuclease
MASMGEGPVDAARTGPQGGYLAKRCPEAVQLDILRPVEPLPSSDFMTMLTDGGIAFEVDVFDLLRSSVAGAVDINRGLDREQREQLTADAMDEAAPLVIGGRLPLDVVGRRLGEPDLLLRMGAERKADGRWSYVAVDVKNHIVRDSPDPAAENLGEALTVAPWVATDGADSSESARCRYDDLLQLAHYQRLLEACGHQAEEGRWGGIIGVGPKLAWYDLDAPRWEPSEYLEPDPKGPLSTMETYEAAFAHRLAVSDAALAHRQDQTIPLLAESILIPACGECGWRIWCYPRLEETADLSLLQGMNLRKRRLHHERGITDLHALAGLDDRTARLIEADVNLRDLMERATTVDPQTAIAAIIPKRRRQIAHLAGEGIHRAADLKDLDNQTLSYRGSGMTDLTGQIDRVRARTGPHPAYRRRGVDHLDVPRGDIELDVDMENVAGGTYLWGVLVTEHHHGQAPTVDYRPFVSWDPSPADGELDAFTRFWDWLQDQRRAAVATGRTLRAYCYSKAAENTQLRRIAERLGLGLEAEIEAFITSEEWVDLYEVFSGQLVTGTRMGLKVVAPLAGFHWRGDEAGGGQSMVRFVEAASDGDDAVASEARRWILEYNEDDVRATAALREWLDGPARLMPSVDTIKP